MKVLLRFELSSSIPGSTPIHETMLIAEDGRLVYHVGAAQDYSRRDQVGTFFANVPAKEVTALAAALSEAPTVLKPDVSTISFRVTSYINPEPRTLPLFEEPTSPAITRQVLQQFSIWRQLAGQAPYSVVKMSSRHIVRPDHDRVSFVFENPGTEAVSFMIRPKAFLLRVQESDGLRTLWQNRDRPRVGLMGSNGLLVDGFTIPANLSPGVRASIAFRLPAGKLNPEATAYASVSGNISFLLPDLSSPAFPETDFSLTCTFANKNS